MAATSAFRSTGVDPSSISIMRSRVGDYPRYSFCEEDLEQVVTTTCLHGGLDVVKECIETLEREPVLGATTCGGPQFGKRGLYHTILNKNTSDKFMVRTNTLADADGQHGISDMSQSLCDGHATLVAMVQEILNHDLVRLEHQSNRLGAGVDS